jgi:hypothetical protein
MHSFSVAARWILLCTAEGLLFHTGVFGDTPPADEAAYKTALGRRFATPTRSRLSIRSRRSLRPERRSRP